MKKEQLLELGIDEEIAKKVMDLNGADIQREEAKYKKAEADKLAAEKQRDDAVTALKGFEGIDPANIKDELSKAQKALKDAQDAHAADLAKRDRKAETEKFLASQEFVNEETREYYMSKLEAALDDESFKGKNRQDILDSFTKNEKGEIKAGVFKADATNPNLHLPGAGGGKITMTKEQFSGLGYKERAELHAANPTLYNALKE